jgi:hypothetical protein
MAPSIDALLGAVAVPKPTASPPPMAAPAPPKVTQAPAAPAAAAPAADEIVEIGAICYAGRGALARAREVRRELIEVLAGRGGAMRPLLDELLDLVELANQPDA